MAAEKRISAPPHAPRWILGPPFVTFSSFVLVEAAAAKRHVYLLNSHNSLTILHWQRRDNPTIPLFFDLITFLRRIVARAGSREMARTNNHFRDSRGNENKDVVSVEARRRGSDS